MQPTSRSVNIFIIDILAMNLCFIITFVYYNGFTSVPLKALLFPILMVIVWYVITLSSTVVALENTSRIVPILKDLFIACSVLTAIVIFTAAVFSDFQANSKLILWTLFFAAISSAVVRISYVVTLRYLLKSPFHKTVLLIGGDRVAEKVFHKLLSMPSLGYTVVGILADYYHPTLPRERYLGPLDGFSDVVRSTRIDEVIIALPLRRESQIAAMVEKCENEGIRARLVPDFFRFVKNSVIIERLDDIPVIGIRILPLDYLKNRLLKRTFDIAFSALILTLISPLFLLVMILSKLTSPGPVFFSQERIGANNRKFVIYKFRTMMNQDKQRADTLWTAPNDFRVTRIGRFLRGTNLDELPQFWNVLKGDMSVVGPRPERAHFVELFRQRIANYQVRHMVKSGITGLAQVNGFRGDTSISSRVECDIAYLENWSFWLDLKIIIQTLFGKSTYKNAY